MLTEKAKKVNNMPFKKHSVMGCLVVPTKKDIILYRDIMIAFS